MQAPDVESIIVSSRCQLLLVEGPFQPTDFLLMTDHFVDIVLRDSNIADQDIFISGSTSEDIVAIPRNCANSSSMALACQYLLVFYAVPKLHFSCVCSDSQNVRSGTRRRTRDEVIGRQFHQSHYFGVSCIPKVDTVAKPNSKQISRRPIDQVQVEIIIKRRRIEHFGGNLANLPIFWLFDTEMLLRKLQQPIGEQIARIVFRPILILIAK